MLAWDLKAGDPVPLLRWSSCRCGSRRILSLRCLVDVGMTWTTGSSMDSAIMFLVDMGVYIRAVWNY